MRFYLLLSIALVFPAAVFAQDKKDRTPGDEMIEKYLAAEADKLSAKYLDGVKSIDEWKQKRPRLYQEYMDMLGLWPIPEKTPLMATKTGEIDANGVVVEKLHFQSKPGLYVTANLYRPKANTAKLPAVVYVCGHSFKGRDGNKTAFQDHGFWFANNGYICMVLDTLQLGEIIGVHHGTYGTPYRHAAGYGMKEKDRPENRFWWHAIGYSPAAVECWNGVRAIDYLCTRPDVDPDKIGVTGISGGGAATFWIAAADERVKVAVPVSGMSDLESYVKNKVINGHCDCMFLYNTYQWDWTTIAAMIAPRPMLFANSDNDSIFPMDGNRRVMAKLRKIYGMYDQPNLVDEYVSKGGHAYRPDLRIAIFKFINKHLKGDTTTPVEDSAKYKDIEARKLRVFPEDSDIPKDALNGRIDEVFIPQAKVKLPEKGRFEEWKATLMQELRRKVFRNSADVPAAKAVPGGIGHAALFEYKSQSGLPIYMGFPFFGKGGNKLSLIVAGDWKDTEGKTSKVLETEENLWKKYLGGRTAFRAWTRGAILLPEQRWTMKSPPNFLVRSHVLLGQQMETERVWDVLALLKGMREEDSKQPEKDKLEVEQVGGRGREGVLAAYAALFEPSIKEVIVIDPPKSHKEGPYFLNVLRVLDIPEALGLLAPRPLTIIGGSDPAFDRTAAIYRLAGAEGKLVRK